jgi:hypothetical protein
MLQQVLSLLNWMPKSCLRKKSCRSKGLLLGSENSSVLGITGEITFLFELNVACSFTTAPPPHQVFSKSLPCYPSLS